MSAYVVTRSSDGKFEEVYRSDGPVSALRPAGCRVAAGGVRGIRASGRRNFCAQVREASGCPAVDSAARFQIAGEVRWPMLEKLKEIALRYEDLAGPAGGPRRLRRRGAV